MAEEDEDVEVDEERIEGEKSGTAVLERNSVRNGGVMISMITQFFICPFPSFNQVQ